MRFFFLFVPRERSKKSKKNQKNQKKIMQQVLFELIFVTRGGAINNHLLKNKINSQFSQTAIPGPSVFEEEEDLEDLHHHGDEEGDDDFVI